MMRVSELLRKLQGAHPDARVVITPHEDHQTHGSFTLPLEGGDVSSVYIDEDGVPELVVKFGFVFVDEEIIPKASYTELPEELHNSDEERNGAWCDRCGSHHSGSCPDEELDDEEQEALREATYNYELSHGPLGHLVVDDGIPVQRRIAVREDD